MKQFFPLILAFIVAVAAFGGYVFVAQDIGRAVARIGSAVAAAEALSTRDLALQSAEVLMKEVAPLSEALESAVLSDDNVVRAIEIVEEIAAEESLEASIANVATEKVATWEHHERVVVTVSVEGTYPRVVAFLSALEAYPAALRIENGSLEQSGTRSWFGTITVTFVKQKP